MAGVLTFPSARWHGALLTGFADADLHGEVKEFGIAVLHLGLVEEEQDEILAAGLVADDQRLVLDVGADAAAVHLHRRLLSIKPQRQKNQESVNH